MPETPSSPAEKPIASDVSLDARFAGKSPNEMLRTIPDTLHGAASVNKIEVPDAKHCLVHIRQVHTNAFGSDYSKTRKVLESDRSEVGRTLVDVQTNIHLILLQLKKTSGLRRVYQEGQDETQSFSNADLRSATRSLKEVQEDIRTTKSACEKLQQSMRVLAAKMRECPDTDEGRAQRKMYEADMNKLDAKFNALLRLSLNFQEELIRADAGVTQLLAAGEFARTSGMDLVPAEKKDVIETSLAFVKSRREAGNFKRDDKEYDQTVLQPREDTLLDIVSKKNDPFAVTIYGGGHDWSDNVKKWNDKNPNDKFSLVVITPKSYPKN